MLALAQEDAALVERILHQAAHQIGVEGSGHEQSEHEARALVEGAMSIIRSMSTFSGQADAAPGTSDDNPQPASQPSTGKEQGPAAPSQADLPADDAQVQALHQQLQERAASVKALRKEVPEFIAQSLLSELESLRPAVASVEDLTAACAHSSGGGPEAQGHSDGGDGGASKPEELQALLAGSLDKLPTLRARMEQTMQRLGRITAAIEAEQGRSTPLKTVEKVLLERPDDDTENICDQTAGSMDGSQATRRRLARELNAKVL